MWGRGGGEPGAGNREGTQTREVAKRGCTRIRRYTREKQALVTIDPVNEVKFQNNIITFPLLAFGQELPVVLFDFKWSFPQNTLDLLVV